MSMDTNAHLLRKTAALWGFLVALVAIAVDFLVDSPLTNALEFGVVFGALAAIFRAPKAGLRAALWTGMLVGAALTALGLALLW